MWFVKKKNYEDSFRKFLTQVRRKKPREDMNLLYEDEFMDIALILIGKPEVVRHGAKPYLERLQYLSQNGTKSVYILAKGKRNTRVAKEVIQRATEKSIFCQADEYPRPGSEEEQDMKYAKCFSLTKV